MMAADGVRVTLIFRRIVAANAERYFLAVHALVQVRCVHMLPVPQRLVRLPEDSDSEGRGRQSQAAKIGKR